MPDGSRPGGSGLLFVRFARIGVRRTICPIRTIRPRLALVAVASRFGLETILGEFRVGAVRRVKVGCAGV